MFTIGYEGLSKREFVEHLKKHGISILVDIREIPLSRKKGFSKSSLGEGLRKRGIEYLHIKQLGSPSEIRHRLKEDKNYTAFFENYSDYLMNNAVDYLRGLYEIAMHKRTCIMCFERDHNLCHRSIVADKLKKVNGRKIEIRHI